MTSFLADARFLVNHESDISLRPAPFLGEKSCVGEQWDTLSQRLEWVLKARGWSGIELAKRAGLSHQHVNLAIAEEFTPKLPTLTAIAAAAKVNLEWLTRGVGTPEIEQDEDDALQPRAAGRTLFLADAKHDGEEERAREFLLEFEAREHAGMVDASPSRWAETYGDGFRAWKRAAKTGGSPLGTGTRPVDEDEEVARPSRKKKK